jgi:hypothetical protein
MLSKSRSVSPSMTLKCYLWGWSQTSQALLLGEEMAIYL